MYHTASSRLLLLPPQLLVHSRSPPISPPSRNSIDSTQPQCRSPHQSPRPKLLRQTLLSPPREKKVCRRPRRHQSRRIFLEALNVEVGAEEEDWGEEHRESLEGSHVLGGDQSCEESGRDGVFWEEKRILAEDSRRDRPVDGVPPHALAYWKMLCLTSSSVGALDGIGIVAVGLGGGYGHLGDD